MTVTIHIQPSGKRFHSEGRSTLLEAGLRAGLALDYGCSNGNCGQCLAKVVSGDVERIRHHDFSLSESQRLQNVVLMCSHTALTDVTLEAVEAGGSRDIPRQYVSARVRNVEIINGNVALLHLKTPRAQRLRFLAGQKVRLLTRDKRQAEHFISSCPCDDMNLHFQVPIDTGDDFARYLVESAARGDKIDVEGPFGDFVLDENTSRELVFVASWTGFAPMRSLIEQAMALELAQPLHLLWIARDPQDRYQHNLCRSWQDAFDNFNYRAWDIGPYKQEVDAEQLLAQLGIAPKQLSDCDFYLADSAGGSIKTTGELIVPKSFLSERPA